MKLTAKQVWECRGALEYVNQKPLPSRVAYEFSRSYKTLRVEIVHLGDRVRTLVEQYNGSIDKDTGKATWADAQDEKAYNEELAEVLKAELDLQIAPLALYQVEHLEFPPVVFVDLDFLFVDVPKPPDKK